MKLVYENEEWPLNKELYCMLRTQKVVLPVALQNCGSQAEDPLSATIPYSLHLTSSIHGKRHELETIKIINVKDVSINDL